MAQHELKLDAEALRSVLSAYARKIMPSCAVQEVYLIVGPEHEEQLYDGPGLRQGARIVVDH